MMTKRFLVAISALAAATMVGRGEEQRTLLTLENRFPELHHFEVDGTFQSRDFTDSGYHLNTLSPGIRYGLIENLTAYAEVPLASSSRDYGDDGVGFGDIKAGLQLLAYKDVFDYPWVVPHAEISLDSGDEGKGLGYGKTVYTMGISVGSKMYDEISLILDVSYAVNSGFESGMIQNNGPFDVREIKDAVIIAGSVVWDVSDRFAVLAEGKMIQDNATNNSQQPLFGDVGLSYKFTDQFRLGGYVGGWTDADAQTDVVIKGSYIF